MGRKASPLQRLHDIVEAIEKIERYMASRNRIGPGHEAMVYDAVLRNIEVVSEATRHVPDELKAEFPDISWRAIADIGNILRHGYDHIRDDIIWQTVEDDLPPLLAAVVGMIRILDK